MGKFSAGDTGDHSVVTESLGQQASYASSRRKKQIKNPDSKPFEDPASIWLEFRRNSLPALQGEACAFDGFDPRKEITAASHRLPGKSRQADQLGDNWADSFHFS